MAPVRKAPKYTKSVVKTLKSRGPKRGTNSNVKTPAVRRLNPLKTRKVARPNTNAY